MLTRTDLAEEIVTVLDDDREGNATAGPDRGRQAWHDIEPAD